MTLRLRAWFCAHEEALVLVLLALAVALRTLLVVASPTSFGYVWDFYDEGIRLLHEQRRLPIAEDCWQCAHPPVFYLLGWPLYALGRLLEPGSEELARRLTAALSLPAAAVVVYYGYRLLRLFGCRGVSLVTGLALLLVCPVLFISSYGAEADIVMNAFLSAFIYYFTKYAAHPAAARPRLVVLVGVLAGLAVATKYSGLVALATAGAVFGVHLFRGPSRVRAVQHGLAVLVICVAIGGWKYWDNVERYGTPLHHNGSAAEGLSLGPRDLGARYEFTTFRLGELRRLFGFEAPAGGLTTFPVYYSVPTSLHALVWSDMSFFSNRTRHGAGEGTYPHKRIPVNLTMAVILLGLVPTALGLLGFLLTLPRRSFQPLAIFSVVTFGIYIWWVIPQDTWAIKPKYILCLLPAAVLYTVVGHAWLMRRVPWAGMAASAALVVLVALTHVYLYAFAVGRLF